MPQTNVRRPSKWADLDNTLQGPWAFRAKERVICLCEGGHISCHREDAAKQKGGNALLGLHSNWVGEHSTILAMSRPWQDNVLKYNLVDAFVRNNIGMILNLQEVGEHENCGPGNLPASGFSYNPDTFMAAQVGFYNFSWRDMGVPDLQKMMDIVQVMDYVTAVEKRRIAVHCHAGLGRTGLAIACFFVFAGTYDAASAVAVVRRYRPGALQTSQQVMFVSVFEQYLAHLRCIFRTAPSVGQTAISCWDSSFRQQGGKDLAADNFVSGAAPAEGKHSSAGATEVFPSGLTIVRSAARGSAPARAVVSIPDAKAAACMQTGGEPDAAMPWNAQLYMLPAMYTSSWQPQPPKSYEEALWRQRQHVHGPSRRAYLNLHWFAKEAAFAVIEAAKAHKQGGSASFARVVCEALDSSRQQDLSVAVAKVSSKANVSSCECLSAPLPVVLRALEEFFTSFDPSLPSLSPEGLRHMSKIYRELPFDASPSTPETLQVAAATKLLAPLASSDHELLVLFAAMTRHVAKASSPGCEAELVLICRWLVQLLLSRLACKPAAEEAVMSFLWCLLRNDAAFAAAIQCKKQRLDKRPLPASTHIPPAMASLPGAVDSPEAARAERRADGSQTRLEQPQQQSLQQQAHVQSQFQPSQQPTGPGGAGALQESQHQLSVSQLSHYQEQSQVAALSLQQPLTYDLQQHAARQQQLQPAPATHSPQPPRPSLPRLSRPASPITILAPLDAPPSALLPPPRLSTSVAGRPLPAISGRRVAPEPASQQGVSQAGAAPAAQGSQATDAAAGGPPSAGGAISKLQLQNLPPTVVIGPGHASRIDVHDVWA